METSYPSFRFIHLQTGKEREKGGGGCWQIKKFLTGDETHEWTSRNDFSKTKWTVGRKKNRERGDVTFDKQREGTKRNKIHNTYINKGMNGLRGLSSCSITWADPLTPTKKDRVGRRS